MHTEVKQHIAILGANGFIGSHLSSALLKRGHKITAIDLDSFRIADLVKLEGFNFHKRDFRAFDNQLRILLSNCDLIVPLVAIATPKTYVTDPIGVFELDFEANLPYIRYCVDNGIRLLFPSTSEVYGLTGDEVFEERSTVLSYGPIQSERWIYANCKQLLDRIIYAYGQRQGLNYTIFRPFNWLGPGLDKISDEEGASRLVSQLLSDIVFKRQITLVDGGTQKRSFTDIRDGISALVKIIESPHNTNRKIYNIGNPANELSIAEFAALLLKSLERHVKGFSSKSIKIEESLGEIFYGKGYQDVPRRVPSIEAAKSDLDWIPIVTVEESFELIISSIDKKSFELYSI